MQENRNKHEKSGTPLTIGIVGCGGVSQIIHLPILKSHNDISIQAVCDSDISKAASVANKFSIHNFYEDIDDLLEREQLDVVFILTPNNLHLPMCLLTLDYGAHVFVEKPAGMNADEVTRIKKQADAAGKTVMVGMQNRFRRDVKALHRFVMGQDLGKLILLKANWLHAHHQAVKQPWLFTKNVSGGGVLMDLGVQVIDLVWWLMDKPQVNSVKSVSDKINKELEVEDFCVACITFQDNISVFIELSWSFPILQDQFSLEIVGDKGTGTLNPLKLQKIMHGQIVNITPEIADSKINNFRVGYENEISHFVDYLTGRVEKLESPIDDAIQIQMIIDGIYQSMQSGSEVKFS
jgi:predicted dehydrogenase